VNWNGLSFLNTCLDSLLGQDYAHIEIIVADCASSDNSVSYVCETYPQVKVIEEKTDKGPPHALNKAAKQAAGSYLLLLNNDTILPPDLISKMVTELIRDENVVLTPVQLNFKHEYVSAGYDERWFGRHLYRLLGSAKHFPMRFFYKLLRIQDDRPFFPCTGCCMVTKGLFLDNPLNENLFLYEDTEWGWRLNLRKIWTRVAMDAHFLHKDGGTICFNSPRHVFIHGRVAIATCYICFKWYTFLLTLPLLLYDYVRNAGCLRRDPRLLVSYAKGFLEFFKRLKTHTYDHRNAQKGRTLSDWQILKMAIGSVAFNEKVKREWAHKTERSSGL
jgi:GT2 family glycosyltransferase